MVAKDSPSEDLPSGWTVLVKVLRTGRKASIYTNVETGKSFASKDEIFKHIEAEKNHSNKPLPEDTRRQEESTSLQSEPINGNTELPDWLPNGWRVEVRMRKSGKLLGKEYKCYIDPSNSGKFYSKLEVMRHIESVKNKSHARKATESGMLEQKNPTQRDAIENHKTDKLEKKCPAQQGTTEKHKTDVLEKKTPAKQKSDVPEKKNLAQQDSVEKHKSSALEKANDTSLEFEHKVVVERTVAEGLPSGWTKVTKFRDSSKVSKKDMLYTDPVSGYVFRSKKDALRYVETGVISKSAFKPKYSLTSASGLTNDEVSTSYPAKRPKLNHPPSPRELFSGKKGTEMNDFEELSKTIGSNPPNSKLSPEVDVMVSSGSNTFNNFTRERAKNSPPLPRGSKREKGKTSRVSDAVVSDLDQLVSEDEPISTPTPKIQKFEEFVETAQEKGSAKEARVSSRKSSGKKVHDLPPRSSKRLAGNEPDKVANLDMGERALMSSIKKSQKTEVSDGSDLLTSNKRNSPAVRASPRKSKAQALEESEKVNDKSEPLFNVLFGSDPCLDFAFKTLTGELPLENHSENTVPHNSSLENGTTNNSNGKGQASKSKSMNKKEPNIPRRSSRRLSGGNSELGSDPLSTEQTHQNANTKPQKKDTTFGSDSVEASLPNKRGGSFAKQKKQPRETGKSQLEPTPQTQSPEIPEPDLSFSIADYWSDPCLDFAFKTLTGVIPIEDSLVQNYFQEQVDKNSSATLSEAGSSSLFQNDIPSHFNAPEKSCVGSEMPSFLQPSNIGLSNCSGVHSQQQSLEGNNDLHRKVKS